MKKLLTLLTLLLCVVVGAKAEEVTIGITNTLTTTSEAATTETITGSGTDLVLTKVFGAGTGSALSEYTKGDKGICVGNKTSYYSTHAFRWGNAATSFVGDYVGYKVEVASGKKFSISKVEAELAASANFTYKVVVENTSGTALYTSSSKTLSYNKSNVTLSEEVNEAKVQGLTGIFYVKLYVYFNGSGKYFCPVKLNVTGGLEESTAPIISSDDEATVKATVSGVAATTDVDVSGMNLTGSTLTATFSPVVEGLTVSLGSSTITAGTISTTATISYVSTVNVPSGSTTLTFSDGTTSKNVTINYSAKVVAWELQPVSEAITWNWEQVPFSTTEINFSASDDDEYDASTWYVMANIEGIDYPDNFDATKISFQGQYPTRNGWAQACTFKIHTTVPGSFTITFSGTGGSASGRWVKVTDANGAHTGATEVSGTTHLSETFKVVAGDVEITGTGALRFYKIVFTPVTKVSGTLTATGFSTYSSNYPVDLSTITGGTAYVATAVTDGKVVLTKCTDKIAVGTGIIIAGEANAAFEINTYAGDATFAGTNLLVGMPNGGEVAAADNSTEFNYVFGWTEVSNPGFYLVNSEAATLPSFKAYLHTTSALSTGAGARLALVFEENETTGLKAIDNDQNAIEGYYNLNGQRVVAPHKGLYIVNGKKVVIK